MLREVPEKLENQESLVALEGRETLDPPAAEVLQVTKVFLGLPENVALMGEMDHQGHQDPKVQLVLQDLKEL